MWADPTTCVRLGMTIWTQVRQILFFIRLLDDQKIRWVR